MGYKFKFGKNGSMLDAEILIGSLLMKENKINVRIQCVKKILIISTIIIIIQYFTI